MPNSAHHQRPTSLMQKAISSCLTLTHASHYDPVSLANGTNAEVSEDKNCFHTNQQEIYHVNPCSLYGLGENCNHIKTVSQHSL